MGLNLDRVFAREAAKSITRMATNVKQEDEERFVDVLIEFEQKLAKEFGFESSFINPEVGENLEN